MFLRQNERDLDSLYTVEGQVYPWQGYQTTQCDAIRLPRYMLLAVSGWILEWVTMCDVPIGCWVEFSDNGRFLQSLAAQIYNDAYIAMQLFFTLTRVPFGKWKLWSVQHVLLSPSHRTEEGEPILMALFKGVWRHERAKYPCITSQHFVISFITLTCNSAISSE